MSVPGAITAVEEVPAAQAIPADALLQAIKELGITHVLMVPDTHQRSLIAKILADDSLQTIMVCTEDEAGAINAGLYIPGHKPMLMIQNNGFYACLNAIKAIALDAQV